MVHDSHSTRCLPILGTYDTLYTPCSSSLVLVVEASSSSSCCSFVSSSPLCFVSAASEDCSSATCCSRPVHSPADTKSSTGGEGGEEDSYHGARMNDCVASV